jgi:hypothetical protein
MYGYLAMLSTAVFIGWAQEGMERQGAGSWHSARIIFVLH